MKEREFRNIIEKHNGILYKIGRSYTQAQADFEDLYQEILIQLWQSFPSFKGESKLSSWIYRVALNTAIRFQKKDIHRRKDRTMKMEVQENAMENSINEEGDLQRSQQIKMLYQCINQLPKEDRALILLHLEGHQYKEIAEIIGISISHVGVKLLRIRKQLFKLLNEKGYARI